jgi:hypothetical protein
MGASTLSHSEMQLQSIPFVALVFPMSEQSQHCGLVAFADIADMGTGRLPRGFCLRIENGAFDFGPSLPEQHV